MNDKKQFIENHPITLSLPTKEAEALIKTLKHANENFVLEYEKTKGVKTSIQYWDFKIYCPTTSFANAYFHLGLLYAKGVLPIWKARWKNKAKKKK